MYGIPKASLRWLLCSFFGFLLGASAFATPGEVDLAFTNSSGANYAAKPAATYADGRMIVTGAFPQPGGTSRVGLVRLQPDGSNDPSFSRVILPEYSSIACVLPLPNGQLLVGGLFSSFNGVTRRSLVRLNEDGSVDQNYDAQLQPVGSYATVDYLALQPDGRLILAGQFNLPGDSQWRTVARLNADGSVDASFSAPASASWLTGLVLQADGRILISGYIQTSEDPGRMGLLRLRPDGTLDRTFTPATGTTIPSVLALLPDGAILAGLRRLLPNGNLDPAWTTTAAITDARVSEMAIQPDGKILFAYSLPTSGASKGVARLLRNGTLDSSWNVGTGSSEVTSIRLEASGSVLAAGNFTTFNGVPRANLVRLVGGEPAAAGSGQVAIVWGTLTVAEGAGLARIAVERKGGNSNAVEVPYAMLKDTATDADLAIADGVIAFAAGESLRWIEIPLVADSIVEGDESCSLTLGTPTGGATLGLATTTLTISDDDRPGRFEWRPLTAAPGEAAGTQVLRVARGGDTFGTVTVDFATVAGTATGDADFTSLSGTLTFLPGENVKEVSLPILEDSAREGSETFTVELRNPSGGASLSADTVATIAIVDNDSPGTIDPSFTAGQVDNGYNNRPRTAVELPDGRILVGGDFLSLQGVNRRALARLNADGSLDASFNANLPADALVLQILPERDGRFLLLGISLRAGTGAAKFLARINADGTFDPNFNPSFGGSLGVIALQPDGKILVAGSYLPGSGTLLRLNPDGSIDSGFTAAAYTPQASALAVQPDGRILIAGGGGLARLHPGGERDTSFVMDAVLNIYSSTVSSMALQPDGRILAGGAFGFYNVSGVFTVCRFLPDGAVDPSFMAPLLSGYQNAYAIALQGDGRVLVSQYGSNGHLLLRLNANGSLDPTFAAAGAYGPGFVVPLRDGGLLANPQSPSRLVKLIGGSLDSSAPATVGFSWGQLETSETAGEVTLWVQREGGTDAAFSVDFSTADDSAHAGVDYTARSGTLAFQPREISRTISIPVLPNEILDGTRAFQVILSNPTGGVALSTSATARVTIFDDERAGHLDLDSAHYFLREGGASLTVKVLRTLGTQGTVGVRLRSINGSAQAPGDFAVLSRLLSFAPGETEKTVTIDAMADGRIEGDEKFDLELSEVSGGALLGPVSHSDVLINDIDDAGSLVADFDLGLEYGERVYAGIQQANGYVLLGGSFDLGYTRRYLIRLNPDGSLDTTFQDLQVSGWVKAMASLPDGKVVVAGSFGSVQGVSRPGLMRLLPDGTLDSSFAPAGGPDGSISALGVQSDGKVIIAGTFTTVAGNARPGLARFNADGSFDSDFQPPVNGMVGYMLVTAQDQIVYATPAGQLARLNANGTSDPSFSTSFFWSYSSNPSIRCLALDPNGQVLVSGYFNKVNNIARGYFVRLLSDGRLDESFNANVSDPPMQIVVQADGRIIWTRQAHQQEGEVARSFDDGTPDPSFRPLPAPPNTTGHFNSLILLPQLGILASGDFTGIDGVLHPRAALLLVGPQAGAFRLAGDSSVTATEGSTVVFEVERYGGSSGRVVVDYETVADTAIEGTDFVATSGTFTFLDGETSKTFSVQLSDDSVYRRDRQFSVRLSRTYGTPLSISRREAVIGIVDNDSPQRGLVQFAAGSVNVDEGTGLATLQINRVGGSDETVSVSYATAEGTAKAGADFTPTTGTLELVHGQTSTTLQIPLLNDGLQEPDETFTVTLTGDHVGTLAVVTVTIKDVDNAVLDTLRGTFSGRLVDDASPAGGAFLKLSLAARHKFTGTLDLGGRRLTVRGTFDANGHALLTIVRPKSTPVVLSLHLDVAPGGQLLTGTLTIDDRELALAFSAPPFNSKTNPAPAVGSYNVLLEHSEEGVPPGAGYARVTVAKSGAVRLTGKLAEGTSWSFAGTLGENGVTPFFVPLYARAGLLQGDLVFTGTTAWDCTGSAHWSKPENKKDPLYGAAFSIPLALDGSAYRPIPHTAVLGFTEGTVRLTDALVHFDYTRSFTLSAANRFTVISGAEKLSLSMSAGSGLIQGRFIHPITRRSVSIQALSLPDSQRAGGFFRGTQALGSVKLAP